MLPLLLGPVLSCVSSVASGAVAAESSPGASAPGALPASITRDATAAEEAAACAGGGLMAASPGLGPPGAGVRAQRAVPPSGAATASVDTALQDLHVFDMFPNVCDIHRSFGCLLPWSMIYSEDDAHCWEQSSN